MTEVSAREFNKDVSAAKRGRTGSGHHHRPRPTVHVLLSIADYRRLLADERSIVDWLSVDDGVDLEPDASTCSSRRRSCDLPARHERGQRAAQATGTSRPGRARVGAGPAHQ